MFLSDAYPANSSHTCSPCVARVFYDRAQILTDRTTLRSTISRMINATTITPPSAPCAVRKVHDPTDGYTAIEVEANGVIIELDQAQVNTLAELLQDLTVAH